ncbi:MAG: hypothetical protein AB1791_03170 [Chloroflexota bacterium]
MIETTFWTRDRFPVVYEGSTAIAVLVDMTSFSQLELILDNLLNREEEPEDAILGASSLLHNLVMQARTELPSTDWERELAEL